MTPSLQDVRRAPKVLLHDHLDGGLRPATVVELAQATGYDGLPTTDADELGTWFRENADAGSLPRYLSTFAHTVGVMQTRDALVRVARECAQDLADDGVVYAEVRFAPELHLEGGLSLTEVVEAVQEGYRQGCEGRPIRVVSLLTAMRHAARSLEIAELAVQFRDKGVVGFDIAGRRGRLPAEPPPGRVPAHAARERPLHDPRRRGLRAAVDLGGAAGVQRRPARPRRAHRRRHLGRHRRHGDARPPGAVRPRQAHPARDVPVEQRADRRGRLDRRAPDRAAAAAAVPRHGQHRQPAHERRERVVRDGRARRGVRLRLGRPAVADDQRDEERVHPVRPAPADHRRGDQAGLRGALPA